MDDVDRLFDGLRMLQYNIPRYQKHKSVHDYLLQTYRRDLERVKDDQQYEEFSRWINDYEVGR